MTTLFKPPPKPTITPPATMPVADDLAVQEAKKKAIAEQMARSGRQSTILTDYSDKLGS